MDYVFNSFFSPCNFSQQIIQQLKLAKNTIRYFNVQEIHKASLTKLNMKRFEIFYRLPVIIIQKSLNVEVE